MKACRECEHVVSEQASLCPNCGAPRPALSEWTGYGYEYKSKTTLWGLPLVHVSFKYSPRRVPIVARGIVAIGQFGVGVVTLAQFGVAIAICQIGVGVVALAQIAAAWSVIAQIGLYVYWGWCQVAINLPEIIGW